MGHHDRLLTRFLQRQYKEGMALASASDLLELVPLGPPDAPAMYLAHFSCTGLLRHNGEVVEHDDFLFGIRFPDDHLRRFEAVRVLTWCEPVEIWHPNIRPPYICVGQMQPGATLPELVHQCFDIVSYSNVDMREHNALNRDACAWARHNRHRFPTDRRPLKRRRPVHSPRPQED